MEKKQVEMEKFYREKDKIYAQKMHEVFNYEYE